MGINKDFREFLQSLNDHDVRYLVVGGYAVAFHGHPRYTRDLDIWIGSDLLNIRNLLCALRDFGFASLGLKEGDFGPDVVIQLGNPPNRIDLLTDVTGLDFGVCYGSRVETTLDETRVAFLDLESLKQNKLSTGRAQDLADLERLGKT